MSADLFSCMGGGGTTGAADATGATGGGLLTWMFPILLIVIFVVLIIVPNRRRDKKFKEMMDSIKVGDRIKTIGGFYGKIISIKDDLVIFECGPDKNKMEISKSAIASVESFDGGAEVNPKS